MPPRARALLPKFTAHSTWQVRMYAARAAGVLSAVDVLTALGADAHHNVREAALAALIDLKRPEAVPAALSALTLDDHQLVLTATRAFTDASTAPKAVPALLTALGRLTKAHRDTSRDPRMAILARLEALGDRSQATALEGYLKDYDPRVAQKAADILTAWTGTPRTIAPSPLPPPGITLAGPRGAARPAPARDDGGARQLRHRPRRGLRAADRRCASRVAPAKAITTG